MAGDLSPKNVKISSQMQIRIPRSFFEAYEFGSEALLVPTDTGIEIRPVKSSEGRSVDLLEKLVSKGLSGEELVAEFKRCSEHDEYSFVNL